MQNRWDSSRRKMYLPDNWAELRVEILERDSYRCTAAELSSGRRCINPATEVDHKTPHYLGGSDDPDNLASLCSYHHSLKSSREGHEAKAAIRAKGKRPQRPHPGTLPKGGEGHSNPDSSKLRQNQSVTTSFWGPSHGGDVGRQDPTDEQQLAP